VLLEHNREEQLIFKHAISTIIHNRRGTGELRQPGSHETSGAIHNSTHPDATTHKS
jgi:hypothetical protein